uniref:ATP-dependent RNA helicase n=1 Tax=Bursaphelenchus xylophilus TaxID=6326 RepID=A0A1I7RQ97_BURXY
MNSVPNSEIDYIKYIIPRNSYSTYHPFLSTGERYIPLGTTDAFYFQPGTSRVKASTESPSTTQPRESISHDCHGYVKSAAQIVRPASSKSTQIASKNENVPFFPPSKKFPPRGQSQFTEENAYCKNNPFVFRGRTQTAGRMQNKLNRSGFDMDEVKASFVLPGPYFEKTIAVDEQELFLYRVELFVSVESFDKCNFEGPTMELIANRGLTQMTAIQKYAIPLLMARENYNTTRALLVRSPSGSGKTLAVALPIISRIFHMKNKDITKKGPFAVFLAHNNIACAQLCKELLAICPDGGPIKVGMSCGSQDPKVINRLIEEGVDILVCTSGRADNHFFRCAGGSVRELQIQRIRYLVLDEADIFLNFNRFYRYVDPIFQKLKATNGKIKLICLTSCYQSVNRFKQLLPEDAKLGIVSVGTETIPPTVRMKCFNIVSGFCFLITYRGSTPSATLRF